MGACPQGDGDRGTSRRGRRPTRWGSLPKTNMPRDRRDGEPPPTRSSAIPIATMVAPQRLGDGPWSRWLSSPNGYKSVPCLIVNQEVFETFSHSDAMRKAKERAELELSCRLHPKHFELLKRQSLFAVHD